jgi:hypothetical protein
VLRHGGPGIGQRVLGAAIDEHGDWQLPRRAELVVDTDYVLAAAGLLVDAHPIAAYRLVRRLLPGAGD